MKKLSIILFMLLFGIGSVQNAQAQLGKLGKKVSNKVKTEERKAKKTGKLPKTSVPSAPSVKTPTSGNSTSTPTVGKNTPTMPSVSGAGEAACKNTESYFKLARKDLDKIRKPDPNAEPLSVGDMRGIVKRVEEQWIPKIETRDPNCDKSKLESEIQEVKDLIEGKKADASFIAVGTYATTGVWETVEFGAMEFEKFTNKQLIKLNGPLGNLEGHMVQKATGDDREAVAFDIEGLGQGIILPHKDAAGNIQYHQMVVFQNQKPVAIILFSNTKTREELELAMDQRGQERLEKENLEPFVKDNLGKIVISTQGPIYKNGKVGGNDGAPDIKLTDSFTLGEDDVYVRMFVKGNKSPIAHLALTGYPPAGEGGAAIRTRIYLDGEVVGEDFFRAVKGDDLMVTNDWKQYRERFFVSKGKDPKKNGAAMDAYREGIEGVFSKNPKVGQHELRIKKFVVNHNVSDPNAGVGENKFPLEQEIADSGPIKMIITENSWEAFCNSGENNYAPMTGSSNSLSQQLLAAVKREAARAGWKETPISAKHKKSTRVLNELTGVYMYTIHEGPVQSIMPNGARLEQVFQMVDGNYRSAKSETYRFLPPKCK